MEYTQDGEDGFDSGNSMDISLLLWKYFDD
jgi:hypothetical protein